MKRLMLLAGIAGFSLSQAIATDAPRGSLLEMHSCEVYAGPCVVNSEAPQEGRSMVRAWDFTGCSFNGIDFSGLQVAVLQLSTDNLAAPDSKTGRAVVYVPETASKPQQEALTAWVKSSQADFKPSEVQTRVAPLTFTRSEKGYTFAAGEFVSIKTASLAECAMGGCGEVLWYQPRSATSMFTVAVNKGSFVSEPLLNLKWNNTGTRSIFMARFGNDVPSKNLYVSIAELCGPTLAAF
jgi:hypothetical protein